MTWMGAGMPRNKLVIGVTSAVAVLAGGATLVRAPAPVTAVLGLALFASLGWTWGTVLLGPRMHDLEGIVVATAMALALPILGGLVLAAARVPLHARAWVGLIGGLILAGDAILLFSRRAARPTEAQERPVRWRPSAWQAVTFGAALIVAIGAVGMAHARAVNQHYPGFTELWLSPLRENTAAAGLGVVNHQGTAKRYRLVLFRQGHGKIVWDLVLSNGETWRRTIAISSGYVTSADLYLLPARTPHPHPYRHVSTGLAPAAKS
jgi:hypothetical protein